MARVGGGYSEFFDTGKKSRWERKVKDQLHRAFQPALSRVSVEWWQFDDNAPKPIQVRFTHGKRNVLVAEWAGKYM